MLSRPTSFAFSTTARIYPFSFQQANTILLDQLQYGRRHLPCGAAVAITLGRYLSLLRMLIVYSKLLLQSKVTQTHVVLTNSLVKGARVLRKILTYRHHPLMLQSAMILNSNRIYDFQHWKYDGESTRFTVGIAYLL